MDDAIFFRKATTQICGTLDPQTVLQRCFHFLKEFMSIDSISMTVYEPNALSFHNIAYYANLSFEDRIPPSYLQKSLKIPSELEDDVSRIIRKNVCSIFNDASKFPIGRILCKETGIKKLSYMILRVEVDDARHGLIAIFSKGIHRYTPKHARLVELIRDPFSIAMTNAIRHQEVVRLKNILSEDNRYLFSTLHKKSGDAIIGKERGLKDVMNTLLQVANLNSLVMLLGETGVGKELFANVIHYNSARAKGPFIKINCGAIPDNLIDSELFGHEKGAFTGAVSNKRGHFERAHNGTLFLDEIGDLPASAQVRLLRVLQQKELIRVGGTQPIKVNVRIITATHHNLEEMVWKGSFREDLWFRINVIPITIPPLRQRLDDIPDLINHFINQKSQEMNLRHRPKLSPQSIKRLKSYDWPGNVRELENCVERALIQNAVGGKNASLEFEDLGSFTKVSRIEHSPEQAPEKKGSSLIYPSVCHETCERRIQSTPADSDLAMSCDELNKQHIKKVLAMTGGQIQGEYGAAAILKVHPSTLRHRLRKLGISFGRQKALNFLQHGKS